jgi:hypothetical protein
MRNGFATTRNLLTLFLILLLTVVVAPAVNAQDDSPKPAKIFTDDRVISARVEGPWKTIMRNKEDDTTWEGVFRYTESDGRDIAIPIEITTRGLTRKRVCDFPPLRFKFEKEAAKGTAFRGAGNLKLVTHCLFPSKYEQYIIKEYTAYRIYNSVTEKSYRVQGLDLSYATGADDDKPIERFGFLIEDPDDVAKRNDAEKLSINDIQPSRLDPMETSRFMLFQYLIANLDWSALGGPKGACCHNARLIGTSPEADMLVAIPYDLDSSGLVNAHYAAPPDGLKVRSVTQRLYRGFCAHNDSVEPALEEFRALRPEFTALLEGEPRMDKGNRKRSIKFIERFYDDLETPKDVQRKLIDNCRG